MKIPLITGIILLAVIIIWIIGSYIIVKVIEKPAYKVIEKKTGYEVREYSHYIVAEVEVSGTQKEALSSGFQMLAGYIFGGNKTNDSISMTSPVSEAKKEGEQISMTSPVTETKVQSEQISMTSPVSETTTSNDTRIIQFSMPSKYTLETLPQPNDDRVTLRKLDGYKAAVLSYTGYAPEEKVEKKKAQLAALLKNDNIEVIGEMTSAQYNPPLSFPFVRRNEIIAVIK